MIYTKEMAISEGHQLKDLWGTPDEVFLPLTKEFNFDLDPCCTNDTAKCYKFYTPADNGLIQSWEGRNVFVNPPYSRGNIDEWVKVCCMEGLSKAGVVVALLPVSTSAKWFHTYVLDKAEIRFFDGRIKFVGAEHKAPFSSLLAIWGGQNPPQTIKTIDVRKYWSK